MNEKPAALPQAFSVKNIAEDLPPVYNQRKEKRRWRLCIISV